MTQRRFKVIRDQIQLPVTGGNLGTLTEGTPLFMGEGGYVTPNFTATRPFVGFNMSDLVCTGSAGDKTALVTWDGIVSVSGTTGFTNTHISKIAYQSTTSGSYAVVSGTNNLPLGKIVGASPESGYAWIDIGKTLLNPQTE